VRLGERCVGTYEKLIEMYALRRPGGRQQLTNYMIDVIVTAGKLNWKFILEYLDYP